MITSKKIYIGLLSVAAISIIVIALLPKVDYIIAIGSTPLVIALCGVCITLVRDHSQHIRNLIISDKEEQFEIGVSSHMANIAFDKHVAFAEEYLQEVQKTLQTLSAEGPTELAFNHSNNLHVLREKFSLWLTEEIDIELSKFETILRKISSSVHITKVTPSNENSNLHLDRQYKLYAEFMGYDEWDGETLTKEHEHTKILSKLRTILNTKELTEIRSKLVKKAFST